MPFAATGLARYGGEAEREQRGKRTCLPMPPGMLPVRPAFWHGASRKEKEVRRMIRDETAQLVAECSSVAEERQRYSGERQVRRQ